MKDRAVLLEHVDLLDTGDWVDLKLFQLGLKFLVISVGCLVNNLLLSAGGTLLLVRRSFQYKALLRNATFLL